MWRNEVNMRKRERARQQAEELRKMQKLFLLKAMSSPGDIILLVTRASNDGCRRLREDVQSQRRPLLATRVS